MNLLSFKFWFNLRPEAFLPVYQKIFIFFVLALIIFSFLGRLVTFRRKGLFTSFWRRIYSFSLTNTFIGLILLFFNYEMVPFLSARFWLLAWATEMIIWLIFIFKGLLDIPKKKKLLEEEKEYKKYIP